MAKTSTSNNGLITDHLRLIGEWDYEKNLISPQNIYANSRKSVWWKCVKGHSWQAKIYRKTSCPYCVGRWICVDNCLAITYPELAKEWHPTRNSSKTTYQFTSQSSQRVWWQCSKNAEHEWEAKIRNRVHGSGCLYCAGKLVLPSESLASTHPELAKEWHSSKNGALIPEQVRRGSGKEVWWKCSKDETHEWQSKISNRTLHKSNCPYCSNRKVNETNCLASTHPELAKEWHPIKNDFLTPYDKGAGSGQKVWWQCSRNKTHEWLAKIAERIGNSKRKGTNCPECYSQSSDAEYRLAAELKAIFPNLKQKKLIEGKEIDILIPELKLAIELDGRYYHKNDKQLQKDIQKNRVLEKAGYAVLRMRGEGLEKISESDLTFDCKHLKLEDVKNVLLWIKETEKKSLTLESKERIETYLKISNYANEEDYLAFRKALPGKFTLGNFKEERPDLAKEWNPSMNGSLLPEHFSLKSGKLVWWQCSKNNEHEWKAKICSRSNGGRCPYCSNKKVCKDNCLATVNSSLSSEWHPSKNGVLTPKDVVANSNKKIWWICSKNLAHEWKTSVDSRHREKTGCPYCINMRIDKTNCLATVNPKLAAEWHPSKNIKLSPTNTSSGSNKIVWWQCSKNAEHEWEASVDSRNRGNGCPVCSGRKVHLSNCLATVNPKLAAEWHPSKNGTITPYDFTKGSKKVKIWWLCAQGHEYKALILTRSHGHGCPMCFDRTRSETAKKRWKKQKKN